MSLYSIRSERQLCEQIDVNLLYRWFLDLHPSEEAFDATSFTKNRERLEEHGLSKTFFNAVVAEALTKKLCSEHFCVEAKRIEILASDKSFRPKDMPDDERPNGNGFKPRNAKIDFHGPKRINDTHKSVTNRHALTRTGRGINSDPFVYSLPTPT